MKLTKEKAEIIDDVLRFIDKKYRENKGNSFSYDEWVIERKVNSKIHVPYEELSAIFHIADTYRRDLNIPPYSGSYLSIHATNHTKTFLDNGGYVSVWEQENKEEVYTEQLRISTLQTNDSVRGINTITERNIRVTNKLFWLTLGVAVLGLLAQWLTYFNDNEKDNLWQQLRVKDSLLQLQQKQLSQQDYVLIQDSLKIDSLRNVLDTAKKP